MNNIKHEQTHDGMDYVSRPQGTPATCNGCAAHAGNWEVTSLCRKLGDCDGVIFIVKPQPKEQPTMSATIEAPITQGTTTGRFAEADRTAAIKHSAGIDAKARYFEHGYKNGLIAAAILPNMARGKGFEAGFDAGFDAGVTAERTRLAGAQYKASTETAPVIERKAGKLNDLIVVSLRSAGPATAEDLSKRLGVPLNSISPRFAKLKALGLAHVASGVRGKSVYAYGAAPL